MQWKNVVLLFVAVLLSLAVLELGLRIGTVHPISETSNITDHPDLGYVMSRKITGVNQEGFRTPLASKVDVAVIGDSHTYGANVNSEQSWPAVLGQATGKSVYNFGVNGYGLLQYATLVDMALAKKPETILLGFFLKNDLVGICRDAKKIKSWQERSAEIGPDPKVCQDLYQAGKARRSRENYPLGRRIKEYSATFSILTDLYSRMALQRKMQDERKDGFIVLINGHTAIPLRKKTLGLFADYMDLAQPEVALAYDVLKSVLNQTVDKTRRQKVRLGVLLIPSRERALYDSFKSQGQELGPEYERLVRNEDQLKRQVAELLKAKGVAMSDALSEVKLAVSRNEVVYPAQQDSHPVEAGYQAYALAARRLVQ